jgi:homocysteine S-methyltransferase
MNEKKNFKELLTCNRPILSDGAMGTLLHLRGATIQGSFEALNLEQPALVAQIHQDYIEAGSQIIQTNTFGANRYKLPSMGWPTGWLRSTRPVWSWPGESSSPPPKMY